MLATIGAASGSSNSTAAIAEASTTVRKVVTLQTLPGDDSSLEGGGGQVGGFSLHAGVVAQAHESRKLERLCRHITRPAISQQRLSISAQGRVRYELKAPWRNGTGPRMWSSSRLTSLPSWRRWCRHRERP